MRGILAVIMALLLVACAGTPAPPENGDDGPGPDPAACRERIDQHITTSRVLENGGDGCDYLLTGRINVTAQLTIAAGTVIVAAPDARLLFHDSGRLLATGTEAERISFSGQSDAPGSWSGLCFTGSHLESALDYVDIIGAGAATGNTSCRAGIGGINAGGEPVHIRNTRVVGSYTSGIDATRFSLGRFENNQMAGNREYGLRVSPNNLDALSANNNFSGQSSGAPNGEPYVFVEPGQLTVTEPQIWRNLGVPYIALPGDGPYRSTQMGLDAGSSAIVEPGTVFLMGNNLGITVREGAVLGLDGRPDQPVVFRGVEDTPGSWRGFWIYGGGMVAQHSLISNTGGIGGPPGGNAGIAFSKPSGLPSHCSHLRNVSIHYSGNFGVLIDGIYPDFVHLEAMEYEGNLDSDEMGDALGPPVLHEGVSCS